jgi:hypothetical protein
LCHWICESCRIDIGRHAVEVEDPVKSVDLMAPFGNDKYSIKYEI